MINTNRNAVEPPIIINNYRTPEVLQSLGVIFYNKCYLCEYLAPNPEDFDVEHFQTQSERVDLVYAWNNLYLACGTCNSIKPKVTPEGGYLDPCNDAEDVEGMIRYVLKIGEYDKPIFYEAVENANQKVRNTITLLKRMHYGHDPNTRRKTASLRKVIQDQATSLITEIALYLKAQKDSDFDSAAISEEKIRLILSRYSSFTMLLRSVAAKFDYMHLCD